MVPKKVVLHFAVLRYTDRLFGAWWPFGADGVASIAYELCFLSLAVLITRLVAELSYRIIEQPFVRLGKNLSRTLDSVVTRYAIMAHRQQISRSNVRKHPSTRHFRRALGVA